MTRGTIDRTGCILPTSGPGVAGDEGDGGCLGQLALDLDNTPTISANTHDVRHDTRLSLLAALNRQDT